jgi:hypothetical protein
MRNYRATGRRGDLIFTVASDISESSIQNLLPVTLLEPRILMAPGLLEKLCTPGLQLR